MTAHFLIGELLEGFLNAIRAFGELHGPILSEKGVTAFAALPDFSSLRLDYDRTLIPPKKYLFPFRESSLRFQDGLYAESELEAEQTVLFGLHACDLEGIAYLDRVFLGDRPDRCYSARRALLTLIGLSCEPDDFCFCPGPCSAAPCDLFLTCEQDGFTVESHTEKGAALVDAARPLLTEPVSRPKRRHRAPIPAQDPQLRFSAHPLWQEFAERCVSCGACSVCCPTCYCFDIREYPDLLGGGTRLREWDNCLFATHGEVAGGNFRPTRLDRLRYRFLHKYCGFTPLEGMTSCVGCGRCRQVCPVDIDLRELLVVPAGPVEVAP